MNEQNINKIRSYVDKYRQKTGTSPHPDGEVGEAVIMGLTNHLEILGKPLCPCNFYPNKQDAAKTREWVCACDEMKTYKYCHCLLFTTPEGMPITEYLPATHDGVKTYGIVKDPTPGKGREGLKAKEK